MLQLFTPIGLFSVHPPLGVGTNGVPPEGGGPGDTGANVGEDIGGDVGDNVGERVGF
jgi:hypothetical protein